MFLSCSIINHQPMTTQEIEKAYNSLEQAAIAHYFANPAYKWHTCTLNIVAINRDGTLSATFHLKQLDKKHEAHQYHFEFAELASPNAILSRKPVTIKVK